jgi:phosphatidylserine/phosphatidylglycerophosphate/cardiolipin synthase-like enzyme
MAKRRSSSSSSAPNPITVIVSFIVVIMALAFGGFQLLTGQGETTEATPTPIIEPGTGTDSWYRLYFTDPTVTGQIDEPTGGIPEQVAASMDTAQRTLDVVVYEFNWEPLAEAMVRAAERGVKVRLVTDTDTVNDEEGKQIIAQLKAANIPFVDDQRSAIMHDKFVVIDGATLWTGSMNFTINDAFKNNNSFMEIRSTRLAENYTAKFEQMFTQKEFGESLTAPNQTVTIGGTEVENYFSPDAGVAAAILEELQAAQKSIYFIAFTFTRDDMANVLIDKAQAGLTVQGVFETRQVAAGADQAWNILTQAALNVRQDGNPRTMHHKVFIIDGETVVMGSYNFTKAAEQDNDENILIIHNANIAQAYFAEFQKVWAVAKQ